MFQSRAESSQEGDTTEVACIRMAHSRCARRVTGCSWSCGRFCWKIPDGSAWRAPWHHHNSTLPGHHPTFFVQPMTHFYPLPRLPYLLPLHAWHPCCTLSIFKPSKCLSVLFLHVGIFLVTVGLVQCPKFHCCTLSNVAKALPP
jgi:hypothetical protein